MEEAVIGALIGTLGAAGLSEALARAIVDLLRDRIKADPAAAKRLALTAAAVVLGLIAVAGLIVALYMYADVIVAGTADLVSRSTTTGRIILTIGGIAVGTILFFFRKYARVGYGVLEVLVAIIGIAGFPMDGNVGRISWLISLLGLIYILVRGLDNVDVGLAARREKAKGATTPAI